jgi:hypothetical protein
MLLNKLSEPQESLRMAGNIQERADEGYDERSGWSSAVTCVQADASSIQIFRLNYVRVSHLLHQYYLPRPADPPYLFTVITLREG